MERARRGAEPEGAENTEDTAQLAAQHLLSGFYLNELVLQLTTRHDPQPVLFETYHAPCRP